MPTQFPNALDTFTNPSSNSSLSTPPHAGQHADANDAIEEIEKVLGTGLSPDTLKNLLSTIPDLYTKGQWFYS